MIIEMLTFFNVYSVFNFLCIIALCVYLFKRFVLSSLYDQRRLERRNVRVLKEEHVRLIKEKDGAIRERKVQEKQGKWLLNKIDIWKKNVINEEHTHEQDLKNSQELLRNYLEDQAVHLSLDHTKAEIAPEAIIGATEKLKKIFSNKDEQEKFIKRALKSLKEFQR